MKQSRKRDDLIFEVINSRYFKIFKDGTIFSKVTADGELRATWKLIGGQGDRTRYFVFKGKRLPLKLVVWVFFKHQIPRNLRIVHRDGDPCNVGLGNLELLPFGMEVPQKASVRQKDERSAGDPGRHPSKAS